MKVRDLYTARQIESLQQASPDLRQASRQAAEAIAEDCWTLDPAWLLDHPGFYEQIKALDDRLTTMEGTGASESEYQAILDRLISCIREARMVCEREKASETATQ